jgi:hypothetical protein
MITQIFVHFLMVLIGVILILITVIKDFSTFSEISDRGLDMGAILTGTFQNSQGDRG